MLAKAAAEGINYQPGWMLAVTTTVKVFIDIFIGVWAFILAYIWTNHINVKPDAEKAQAERDLGSASPNSCSASSSTFAVGLASRWRSPAPGRSSPPRSAKPTRSASSSSS